MKYRALIHGVSLLNPVCGLPILRNPLSRYADGDWLERDAGMRRRDEQLRKYEQLLASRAMRKKETYYVEHTLTLTY